MTDEIIDELSLDRTLTPGVKLLWDSLREGQLKSDSPFRPHPGRAKLITAITSSGTMLTTEQENAVWAKLAAGLRSAGGDTLDPQSTGPRK